MSTNLIRRRDRLANLANLVEELANDAWDAKIFGAETELWAARECLRNAAQEYFSEACARVRLRAGD